MIQRIVYLLWSVALITVSRPAMALRDNGLNLLSTIRMPHTFTVPEMRIMKGQLDTLRLGIDLVLSMLGNMTEADKQATFTSMWPGVKCIFNSDFTGGNRSPLGPTPQQPQSGMPSPNQQNQAPAPAPPTPVPNYGNQQNLNQPPDPATGQPPSPNQVPPTNPQPADQQPTEPLPPTDSQSQSQPPTDQAAQ